MSPFRSGVSPGLAVFQSRLRSSVASRVFLVPCSSSLAQAPFVSRSRFQFPCPSPRCQFPVPVLLSQPLVPGSFFQFPLPGPFSRGPLSRFFQFAVSGLKSQISVPPAWRGGGSLVPVGDVEMRPRSLFCCFQISCSKSLAQISNFRSPYCRRGVVADDGCLWAMSAVDFLLTSRGNRFIISYILSHLTQAERGRLAPCKRGVSPFLRSRICQADVKKLAHHAQARAPP